MTIGSITEAHQRVGFSFTILHTGLKAIIKSKECQEEIDHSVFGVVFRRFVVNINKVIEVQLPKSKRSSFLNWTRKALWKQKPHTYTSLYFMSSNTYISPNSAEDSKKLSFCYFNKTLLFFITDYFKCGNTAESEQRCLFHDILGFFGWPCLFSCCTCSAAALSLKRIVTGSIVKCR